MLWVIWPEKNRICLLAKGRCSRRSQAKLCDTSFRPSGNESMSAAKRIRVILWRLLVVKQPLAVVKSMECKVRVIFGHWNFFVLNHRHNMNLITYSISMCKNVIKFRFWPTLSCPARFTQVGHSGFTKLKILQENSVLRNLVTTFGKCAVFLVFLCRFVCVGAGGIGFFEVYFELEIKLFFSKNLYNMT